MFAHQKPNTTKVDVVRFLDWLKAHEASEHRDAAKNILSEATASVPAVGKYSATPQGAPWHTEGPRVSNHIERILFALENTANHGGLQKIEEFAREKDLVLEVEALENTIRTHKNFLQAFALAHDIAKPEMLTFDAKPETKGAAEGFALKRHPTAPELARYDKLLRAFELQHEHLSTPDLLTAFFAEYGIETHYDQHGPRAAGPEYAAIREAILKYANVPLSYAKLLAEILRYHIDVLFDVTADKYRLIAARAGKAGLNVDLVLDITLAHVFLDAVAGSLASGGAQTDLVIRHMRAEREAFPERHAARELVKHRQEKQAQKDILAAAGLEGEEIFRLLGTPIGPERGVVMRQIQEALKHPGQGVDLGPQSEEVMRRIAFARERLSPAA